MIHPYHQRRRAHNLQELIPTHLLLKGRLRHEPTKIPLPLPLLLGRESFVWMQSAMTTPYPTNSPDYRVWSGARHREVCDLGEVVLAHERLLRPTHDKTPRSTPKDPNPHA